MIESKEQLLTGFRCTAQAFLEAPGLTTGIDFDDAAVTLKRYVLSVMHDEDLGSVLARFPRLIRELDTGRLAPLVTEVLKRMAD